jgi:hypothetical protein
MAKAKRDYVTGLQWGVFILSVLATPIAIHAVNVLALSGPSGPTMLYPFMQIVKSPCMSVPADLASTATQWIMYLQFPLYGVLVAKLIRPVGLWVGLGAAALLHCLGIGAAYYLAHAQNLRFY